MVIPFVDLKSQYLVIKDEIDAAIENVLNTCQFTLGSEVAAFEKEFAEYCQGTHGVGVNTGTSALHLALLAAGSVRVTKSSRCPSPSSRRYRRSSTRAPNPVFVDIDPRSFTMDVTSIEARSPHAPRRSCPCTCTASRPTWIPSWTSPADTD
jgi:dTDP-4-amino-4,6-dideoxygalactose transaminase